VWDLSNDWKAPKAGCCVFGLTPLSFNQIPDHPRRKIDSDPACPWQKKSMAVGKDGWSYLYGYNCRG